LSNKRWSGALATASDPYFHSPSKSSEISPTRTSTPLRNSPSTIAASECGIDSAQPTDIPSTPASISTSTAAEIEEYLELLDAEQEEKHRYELDPARLERDLEINERVNRSLAIAEDEILAREILSPRSIPERKTVQFIDHTPSPLGEEDSEDLDSKVAMKRVYIWDSFRDFVTVTSVTGFEDYISQPRSMGGPEADKLRSRIRTAKTTAEQSGENVVKMMEKEELPENTLNSEVALPTVDREEGIETKLTPDLPQNSYPPALQTAFPTTMNESRIQKLSVSVPTPTSSSPDVPVPPASGKLNNIKLIEQPHPVVGRPGIPNTTALSPELVVPTTTKGKEPPVDHLKAIAPPQLLNTWNLPSAPLVKVEMSRAVSQREEERDEFLVGLGVTEKVAGSEGSSSLVVRSDEKGKSNVEGISVSAEQSPIQPSTSVEILRDTAGNSIVEISVPTDSDQVARSPASVVVSLQGSGDHAPTRAGMPIPVPATAKPKPAVKSPTKPAIAPKPVGLSKAASKKKTSPISPFVGGLVDPFLAALQPEAKKFVPSRPKTPSLSSESGHTTSDKAEVVVMGENTLKSNLSNIPAVGSAATIQRSQSGTTVEPTKNESPQYKPARQSSQGVLTPTPAPTPSATPIIQPTRPPVPLTLSSTSTQIAEAPTSSKSATSNPIQGRKLFTFELKVGESIVTTPVHENDDPRGVAETFAKEHDLESRLPGGRGTVEKIVQYFETQFIERKEQREKRRSERREKLMKQRQESITGGEKSFV
jgi:hypothetical protein